MVMEVAWGQQPVILALGVAGAKIATVMEVLKSIPAGTEEAPLQGPGAFVREGTSQWCMLVDILALLHLVGQLSIGLDHYSTSKLYTVASISLLQLMNVVVQKFSMDCNQVVIKFHN